MKNDGIYYNILLVIYAEALFAAKFCQVLIQTKDLKGKLQVKQIHLILCCKI